MLYSLTPNPNQSGSPRTMPTLLSGIVYCLRGCSNDIARAVVEFIPIVISFSFFSISYNKLLRNSFGTILEGLKFPARIATGTIR